MNKYIQIIAVIGFFCGLDCMKKACPMKYQKRKKYDCKHVEASRISIELVEFGKAYKNEKYIETCLRVYMPYVLYSIVLEYLKNVPFSVATIAQDSGCISSSSREHTFGNKDWLIQLRSDTLCFYAPNLWCLDR